MNSVMDDNKVLTLINGERIAMPEQVQTLRSGGPGGTRQGSRGPGRRQMRSFCGRGEEEDGWIRGDLCPREECRVYCGCGEQWPVHTGSALLRLTSAGRLPPTPGLPGSQAAKPSLSHPLSASERVVFHKLNLK